MDQKMQIDRRRFLEVGIESALGLWIAQQPLLASTPQVSTSGRYAAMAELSANSVSPSGWMRLYLQKQADQLGYSLPDVSEPFTGKYWEGEEKYVAEHHEWDESWWAWEQHAYWIDGALRCGLLLNDQRLLRRATSPIVFTLQKPGINGYLGPAAIQSPTEDCHRWPHTIFFRAVSALADARGDTVPADLLRKHYVSDTASYAKPVRNVTNIESMLWAYERTGDKRLVELAETTWESYLQLPPNTEHGDLARQRVLSDAPVDSHGVTYIETAKIPAILYMHTGKRDYLDFALAAQHRILSRYMLVDGVPSTSESYESTTSRDVHETCDIADHTWTWGYLLMATGDGAWADRIERACLNAGFGAIRKDWKGLQYLSCPNQMLATQTSSHIPNSGRDTMSYQPNPGRRVACCAANVHRIFPNYVQRMWMHDSRGGLAAVFYGPSTLKTRLGKANQEVEIEQTTDYPFDETIRFTIRTARPFKFPLSFRIPGWCTAPHLELNGVPEIVHRNAQGFFTIERSFRKGDQVVLKLPMQTRTTEWPHGGVAVEHGPLVYALPIQEHWTSKVIERWSTEAFPSWEALPASVWNYAVALKDLSDPEAVRFERTAITTDPWVDPPVKLSVPARRVPDWKLVSDPTDSSIQFSPQLPSSTPQTGVASEIIGERDFLPKNALADKLEPLEEVDRITLVPYGATHLRVTIFPNDIHKT